MKCANKVYKQWLLILNNTSDSSVVVDWMAWCKLDNDGLGCMRLYGAALYAEMKHALNPVYHKLCMKRESI